MAITTGTLLAYVEQKTQAGTGTLNSANGISFLNEALLDFRSELIKRGVDASGTQEAYVNTVTPPSSGNGSTFSYPSDMYFLKTITVNMTDSNPQNYVRANIVDVSNTQEGQSFEWLRANQPSNIPLFDDRGDTYEIFPSFTSSMNLVNAIRIFYYLTPTPYITTSDNLTYPDTLDWYCLALKVASIYYESLNKFEEADVWQARYDKRLAKLITTEAQGSQQPIQPGQLGLTGFEF